MTFKSEIAFVRILVPTALGIYFGYSVQRKELMYPIALTLLSLFGILLLLNLFYKSLKIYRHVEIPGILITILWFIFGCATCIIHIKPLGKFFFADNRQSYLRLWISDEPQRSNQTLRFEAQVIEGLTNEEIKAMNGKLLITIRPDDSLLPLFEYGDEIVIPAKYSPVEPSFNPGEFDFKAWLATKDIYHQAYLSNNEVVKLPTKTGNPLIKYAINLRRSQVQVYRRLIKNDEAFAVASTLVLGYRSDLNQETLAAYSKTGTIHALSVSGMHVGIIYIFLSWALGFLDRKLVLKLIKVALILTLIWYYALLTGLSPSVLRSAIMLTVYILAKTFNKNSNSYNILAFTAFCLLVYDPLLLYDVGFQLSFLAVFGLIYLQPKIYKWIYFRNKWVDKLWATVALSMAAQLATFPLSIYYFHQFPIYFIVSNLFILLPLSAMMYLGVAILLLRLYFLAPIFEWIINFTNIGLKWIAHLPFSGISAIWIDRWQVIVLSLSIIFLVISLAIYSKKMLMGSLFLLLTLQISICYGKLSLQLQRKILFFSLRKNSATAFIEGPNAVLVTDLEKDNKTFAYSIQPAMDQLQVKNIKILNWNADLTLGRFVKKNHQIVFHNYTILLLDDSFNHKIIHASKGFDMVYLHQSPRQNIATLRKSIPFTTLMIDATNKAYQSKMTREQANKIGVFHYTLKKNKAYLIDLM